VSAAPSGAVYNPGAFAAAPSLGNPYGGSVAQPYPSAGLPASSPYGSGPYGGADPYSGSPYSALYNDSVGSYLRGSAQVILAQAQFGKAREEAALAAEQVRQARIVTRQRALEADVYLRTHTPTYLDQIERERADAVGRSQNGATPAEIWSGQALNTLLEHAAALQGKGVVGPQLALNADDLKRINVRTPEGGNVAVLKNDGQLSWPQLLHGPAFDEPRKRLDQLAPQAVKQAQFGRVDPGTLHDLAADLTRLHALLARGVHGYTPSEHIEARRFLNQLDGAMKALRSANATHFFTKKYTAQGETVAELVKHMAREGLRFAPAAAEDEPAYVALHRLLAAYSRGLQDRAARE
jgi:hypothetical protein